MDTVRTLTATAGLRVREYEPMSRHTNFRIGGPARYYVEARTPEEVHAAVEAAREAGLPWFVLGGGSNTLVADAGFDGLVIQLANREIRIDGTRAVAGAGAISAVIARTAGDAGLTGFEWAISLPGTIGGAVRGNAGCFGGEMRDTIERMTAFNGANGRTEQLSNSDCGFRYRHSTFKERPEWIIIEVTLALRAGDRAECQRRMDEQLTLRRTKQPLERPSAGCLFTNIEETALTPAQLTQLDAVTGGVWRTVAHDGQIPTGWLVERIGCKGFRVGDAMISEKHGNFIINLENATAADVVALSDIVRTRIRDRFGLELNEEVQRVGC